jgi:trigger factor
VKSAVETLTPTRVKLTVEVPFDELKPSLDAAYRRIAGQVNIPGFRRGKVPAAIIDQRVGRGAVLDEAINEHLPKAYNAAAQEHGVKALGQPDVDVTEFADGEQLTFTAEVDVRPEIELPDYDGLEVTVDDAAVTDADVDDQLTSLAARFASLTPVERPVEDGDFVTIDLSATHEGHAVEDATASGMSYEVGSGTLLEGLDAAVVGLSAGESATFTDRLRAGGHADEDVDVEVTVTAVKVRNMPALDDDFAQLASEFDTLDELKDDLRRRLADYKKVQQGVQARDRALQKLLSLVEVPLPEALVQAQIDSHFQDGHGDAEHRAGYDKEVREGLAAQFVLDEVAAKEELSVGEGELSEYIVANAQQYGMTPDQFAQEIVNAGQVPAVVGEVVRAKALALILERATVTDESGNAIDLASLGLGVRPEPAETTDDAHEAESEGDDEG